MAALGPHRKAFGEPAFPLRLGLGHGGRSVVAKQEEPDRKIGLPTHRYREELADSRSWVADKKDHGHLFAMTGDFDLARKSGSIGARAHLFTLRRVGQPEWS